ncbi:MAG: biotin/lipoyl-containing protein [Xanthobacteraceae bacterium]
MSEIAVPEGLWDTSKTPEGIVGNWFYRDGSMVEAGAKVAELMVEKTVFDITAPAAGELHILVPKDGVVRPGTLIGRIDGA